MKKGFIIKISLSLFEYEKKKTLVSRIFKKDPGEVLELKKFLENPIVEETLRPTQIAKLHEICVYAESKEGPIFDLIQQIKQEIEATRPKPLSSSGQFIALFSEEKKMEDVNHKGFDGRTLLIEATIHDHLDKVLRLLQLQADPLLRDNNNKNAFQYAIDHNNDRAINLLLNESSIRLTLINVKNIMRYARYRKDINVKIIKILESKKKEILSQNYRSIEQEIGSVEKITYPNMDITSPVGFLIEGASQTELNHYRTSNGDTRKFLHQRSPEICGAVDLAMLNNAYIFHPIVSFNFCLVVYEVLEKTLKMKPRDIELRQKIIVIAICEYSLINNPISYTIDIKIKPAFHKLLMSGKIKKIPDWIVSLKSDTYDALKSRCIKENFHGNTKKFILKLRATLESKGVDSMNDDESFDRISRIRMIQYLKLHPQIKKVYSIIGKAHVGMFGEKWGDKILTPMQPIKINKEDYEEPAIHSHVQIQLDTHTVEVHTFGGFHNNDGQYKKMRMIAQQEGLRVPSKKASYS